ncbi:MAG: pyroglutamyl-peptidase I [Candidatus Aenigmarchaeota archaeon]|nr:pyroglutamyl-peptidase I [Candidatus Aenigmarchaeota archaeon]
MRRAILTGFEPFGPYKYNPVQDAAREYNGKSLEDIEVVGLVVPCTYYGAFELLSEKIDELSPDIILGTGLASGVKRIRLESIGRNIMNGKYTDAEGRKPDNEPIVHGGKLWYPTTSDNIILANSLYESGISAEVSVDAEGFICNSLIYLTAKRISDESLPTRFTFFHTPWTEDYLDRVNLEEGKVSIKKSDLRKTIEILVKEIGRGT